MNPQFFKSRFYATLNFIIFLFLTASCTSVHADTDQSKRIYKVGFAQDTMSNDWRRAQANALAAEFKKHANIKFILTDAGGNSAKQIQDIEDLAHQKVDVLITSPRDGVMSTPAIARIYKQGIPVVLVTRSIASNDYTSLVAPDDYMIASNAADYLAKKLSGKGSVLIIRGVPTATTAIARTQGFLDRIKKYPAIKIAAIKDGNYLRGDAVHVTEKALLDGIKFDAIYAQSDSMAVGARLALKKSGISPKDKLIIGIDYIKEAQDAIQSGEQLASFVYPTCAKETAKVVLDILKGKKVPKKITVKSKMITKANVRNITPIF